MKQDVVAIISSSASKNLVICEHVLVVVCACESIYTYTRTLPPIHTAVRHITVEPLKQSFRPVLFNLGTSTH